MPYFRSLTLTLALLLSFTSALGQDSTALLKWRQEYAADYSWHMACGLTKLNCKKIERPKIKFERLEDGLLGFYDGGDTVFVSNRLRGNELKSTTIHEIIHYLHVQAGLIRVPGMAVEVCWSEAEAFALVDIWWDAIGKPAGKRGPKWWRPYTYCWPYYAPRYEVIAIDGWL